MSLEATIAENTSVMRELIARLTQAWPIPTVAPAVAEDLPITRKQPEESAPKAAKKVETPKPAATQPAAPEAAAASPSEPLDYARDVKPVLIKVSATKGREALIELLGKHGVAKGDQLSADKLAVVLDEARELLAA